MSRASGRLPAFLRAPRSESSIERGFLRQVKRRWPTALVRKMNGLGARDWPDRMLILPTRRRRGAIVFIEFKRPGETPRPTQEHLMGLLVALGARVHVCDDIKGALRACEDAIAQP